MTENIKFRDLKEYDSDRRQMKCKWHTVLWFLWIIKNDRESLLRRRDQDADGDNMMIIVCQKDDEPTIITFHGQFRREF